MIHVYFSSNLFENCSDEVNNLRFRFMQGAEAAEFAEITDVPYRLT